MKIISSYSFQFNEMARPAGLEPAAFCLEAVRTTLPNLARGVANRTNSAKFWITTGLWSAIP